MQRSSSNIKILREFSLVEKLLLILKKSEGSSASTLTLLNVLHALLCTSPRVTDVLCFTQFTVKLKRSVCFPHFMIKLVALFNKKMNTRMIFL